MDISPLGAAFSSRLILHDLIKLAIIYLVKIKNHDAPHYVISSSLLTLSPSSVQTLSSAP
jgi:hypothetical protein